MEWVHENQDTLGHIAIDLIEIDAGASLITGGATLAAGGGVVEIGTGGIATVIAVPAAAVGVTGVVTGGGLVAHGGWNLGKDVGDLHWNNQASSAGGAPSAEAGAASGGSKTPNFDSVGSGDNLKRTAEIDGEKWQFNTGHAFNRAHNGPKGESDLRTTTLTPDQIETSIARDTKVFEEGGGVVPRSGTPAGKANRYVDVNGTKIGYRLSRTPDGVYRVPTYWNAAWD
jgi:hypothetical protein